MWHSDEFLKIQERKLISKEKENSDILRNGVKPSKKHIYQDRLTLAKKALKKIRVTGNYGICEDCGEEIGTERLRVHPIAARCIDCREQLEKESQNQKPAADFLNLATRVANL